MDGTLATHDDVQKTTQDKTNQSEADGDALSVDRHAPKS